MLWWGEMLSTRGRHHLVNVCVYKDWPPSSFLDTTILETCIHMRYYIIHWMVNSNDEEGQQTFFGGGKC